MPFRIFIFQDKIRSVSAVGAAVPIKSKLIHDIVGCYGVGIFQRKNNPKMYFGHYPFIRCSIIYKYVIQILPQLLFYILKVLTTFVEHAIILPNKTKIIGKDMII